MPEGEHTNRGVVMESLERRVIEFVRRLRGNPGETIDLCTTLQADLGTYGDDASEFFFQFAQEFHVDLSALHFDQYFPPEIRPWREMFKANDAVLRERPQVSVAHLVRVVQAGRWVDVGE